MNYGSDNLFRRLRSVLVCKPIHDNITKPINIWQERFKGKIDRELALKQHENMVEVLEREGVSCYFLKPIKGTSNQHDSRDVGILSEKGYVAGKFKKEIRRKETASFIDFCAENGIRELKQGIPFEGGDFFFLNEKECLVGVGARTETKSEEIGALLGRKITLIPHDSSHHLDGVFNVLSENLVVAHTGYIKEQDFLKDKEIIALTDEDIWNMSSNFLLLGKNKILADSNCQDFNKRLKARGIEVLEVDVSELKKNGGSIRCMTLPILRR